MHSLMLATLLSYLRMMSYFTCFVLLSQVVANIPGCNQSVNLQNIFDPEFRRIPESPEKQVIFFMMSSLRSSID